MEFLSQLSKIINSGQSRSVMLTGNVNDLFYDGSKYVPLVNFLSKSYAVQPSQNKNGKIQLIYEINNPIRVCGNKAEISSLWDAFKGGPQHKFDDLCENSKDNPVLAFEFLRWLTICSREAYRRGDSNNDLLIVIEAADMLMPNERISALPAVDRKCIGIVQDWISDPDFMQGPDSVILISESASLVHQKISTLPQLIAVDIPAPTYEVREKFIKMYGDNKDIPSDLAKNTASLSLHALRQLLCLNKVSSADVMSKVQEYISSQLGEDIVEFKKPTHKLGDVIGFTRLKEFFRNKIIPRIKGGPETALSGAAIGGPIGGGKTFICEAMASELDLPVLVLKNLRSQWYGQTDVIFERLKRTLMALDKVVIFLDEADTQLGGVGPETHETERRLTGKIQAMMSDPQLKGKVTWLLMTARIHLLSPDIRRPGRAGDLIIPVLDPEGDDIDLFLKWVFKDFEDSDLTVLRELTKGYSVASFAALKSLLKAENCQTKDEVISIVSDMILPDIGDTREYQILQAKMNCTRQSLLFDKPLSKEEFAKEKETWKRRLEQLEKIGMK